MRLVFDIEANGLYYEASVIHCLVAKDLDTGETHKFEPSKVKQGLDLLMSADVIIGHNVIGYDIPVMRKLFPRFVIRRESVIDTLVLSRLLYSNLAEQDYEQKTLSEPKLYGSHSLKAWGHRLGELKDEYEGGFDRFSVEMLEYNVQDVNVTEKLYKMLSTHVAYSEQASTLEHKVAFIVNQQEHNGFLFDVREAENLTANLQIKRFELEHKLQETFQSWEEDVGEFTPKVNNKKLGYTKGVPFMKTKTTIFNPGSRHHIANRLKAMRGWKPKDFTPDGSARVDEAILSKLKYPEAELLSEYLMIQKRLGMLAEGNNGWLKMVKRNSRIHGEVITNGAVTGRATHRNPNVAQVPAVGAQYGKECRSLFTVPKDKFLVGVDVSGLELRMLAHFMKDNEYAREVCEGDVHTVNMQAAGLETRNQAKKFIYTYLYGGGDLKVGEIAGMGAAYGKMLKERFLAKTPALATLVRQVKAASKRGYLIGLDGRRLHIRSDHAALNVLLQSAGALVCKQFMVEVDQMLTQLEWSHKVHQVAWIHDECQFECDQDVALAFGKLSLECIKKAGDFFKISVPLTGEYKIGTTWAETH